MPITTKSIDKYFDYFINFCETAVRQQCMILIVKRSVATSISVYYNLPELSFIQHSIKLYFFPNFSFLIF